MGGAHRVPCPQPVQDTPPRAPHPQPPSRQPCEKQDVKEGPRDKSAGKWTKNNTGLSQSHNRCQRSPFSLLSVRSVSSAPSRQMETDPTGKLASLAVPLHCHRVGHRDHGSWEGTGGCPKALEAVWDKPNPAEQQGGGPDPALCHPLCRKVSHSTMSVVIEPWRGLG